MKSLPCQLPCQLEHTWILQSSWRSCCVHQHRLGRGQCHSSAMRTFVRVSSSSSRSFRNPGVPSYASMVFIRFGSRYDKYVYMPARAKQDDVRDVECHAQHT